MIIELKQEGSVSRSKFYELLLVPGNSDRHSAKGRSDHCTRVWTVLDFGMDGSGLLTH